MTSAGIQLDIEASRIEMKAAPNKWTAAPVEMEWNPSLPIYASPAFLKVVGDECGWIGGTDPSGQLRCVLPYTVIRKPGFRMVRFRNETAYLGAELGLAEPDLAEEKAFLNAVVEYFRSAGADMIIPGTNNALFRAYPDGSLAAPYGTVLQDLGQSEETLWSGVGTDYRQNIRKATKAGVQIKTGLEHLDTTYHLIADTLKRSKMKFRNYDEFKRIMAALGEHVRIFVAEYEGVVQACMVSPFSEHSAYDWYSGTIPKSTRGAMHLLIWEAIREFHGMGVKRLNFTGVRINPEKGSKQEGILTFKMRFGGRLVEGYMWKYSFRPLKFAAYSLASRVLWGGDIVDMERHKMAAGK